MTRNNAAQVARMNGASICGLCTQPFVEAINSVLLCRHHLDLVHAIAADAGVPREAEVSKPVAKLHSSQQMVECPTCHKITKGAGPAAVHRKLCGARSEHRAPSTEHRAPSEENRPVRAAPPAIVARKPGLVARELTIAHVGTVAKFVGISEAEVTRLISCLEYISNLTTTVASA